MATRKLLAVAKVCLAAAILALPGSSGQADSEREGASPTPPLPTNSRRVSAEQLRALRFEEYAERSYRRENVRLDQISAALGFSVTDLVVELESLPKDPGDTARCYFANASCEVFFGDAKQARAKVGSSIVTVLVDLYPEPKKWPADAIHVTAGLLEQAGFTKDRDGVYVRDNVEVAELCAILQCSADEFTRYYLMNDHGQSKRYSLSFPIPSMWPSSP